MRLGQNRLLSVVPVVLTVSVWIASPSSAQARPALAKVRTRPPAPKVHTLGVTRSATLFSYCWSFTTPAGGGQGVCADGIPGHAAHHLHWRPGATVRIDLGLPAHDVGVEALNLDGPSPTHILHLKLTRRDRLGGRWAFRLPRRAAHDTDLLISARYAHGDAEADIGLRS